MRIKKSQHIKGWIGFFQEDEKYSKLLDHCPHRPRKIYLGRSIIGNYKHHTQRQDVAAVFRSVRA